MNLLNPYEAIFKQLAELKSIMLDQQENQTTPEYLLVPQASEFISVSPNALRVMVHKNQIPFIKKHGKLFFKKSDLIEWLESGRNITLNDSRPEDILINNN